MKELYIKPECVVKRFNTVEILTASNGDDNFEPFPTSEDYFGEE